MSVVVLTKAIPRFRSMLEVKIANRRLGHFFFEPGTLRFFDSRIGRRLYGGRYFLTSERFDEAHPRLYTVREANPDGSIDTVGEFQGYTSWAAADRAARELAEQVS